MPSEERFELRVSAPKLLTGLLVAVVPFSLVGLYSLAHSHAALEKTIGVHFRTIAESAAAAASQFVSERVVDVGMIAVEPAIVEAVTVSNRSYQNMPNAAVAARIERLDKMWNTPEAAAMVKEMVGSRASRLLNRYHELDRRILRVTVTDAKGATVAASHKTLDYYQGDEEYWQNIYAQGRGAVNVTDILYDEATKANYIGVGVPVFEEGSSQFIGTVDALVDISSVFPVLNRVQIGPTGRIMLVKDDGTVISAPGTNLAMRLKSDEYAAVQEAQNTPTGRIFTWSLRPQSREPGYVVANVKGLGQNLIGYADTGLKQDYRNLGWIVLVCQSTNEAFSPVRLIERVITLLSLIGLLMATVLIAYFSMHRRVLTRIGELSTESPSATPAKSTAATK